MKNISLFSQKQNDPRRLDAWSAILPIAFDLVCGVLLLLLGNLALRVTAYALSGLLIISGVWMIISYYRSTTVQKIIQSKLAYGLALLVSGVLLAFNPDYLKDFLPFVWGLAMLFGAFMKVQYAFNEKALNIQKWWILLICAGFSLIIGILSLANPSFLEANRGIVIGILLIAEAVLDLVVFILISRALRNLPAEAFPGPYGAETRAKIPIHEAPIHHDASSAAFAPATAPPMEPAAPAPEGLAQNEGDA